MYRQDTARNRLVTLICATLLLTIATTAFAGPLPLPSLFEQQSGQPATLSEKGAAVSKGVLPSYPSLLLYQKDANADTNYLGYSMDGGRDVNGDGVPDFIVGAPVASPGGVMNAGSAFVYSGLDGSLLYQINGTDSAQVVGVGVALLGDINGDGRSEFVIGAPYADPGGSEDAGSVYVYSGIDGSLLQQKDGADVNENFGWSVARAGNVNADGTPDYIVGVPYADSGSLIQAGAIYVYSGVGGGLIYRKFGAMAYDNFGYSVDGVGNVNGDARSDFIVGAPYGDSSRGAAYVFSGLTGDTLYHVTGDTANGSFGWSVAGAGDVNLDGRSDFIVGAPYESPGAKSSAGSAYIFSGSDGVPLRRVNGNENDLFGYSVAGAGDVNGDGKDDVIIGAPGTDPFGIEMLTGAVHVYSVQSGVRLHRSYGSEGNATYGFKVARAGDLNGDGKSEFMIGAALRSYNGNMFAGSAYVRAWGAFEEITDLTDIGNDQGKQLRIQWSNIPGDDGFIQEFVIYRRVDDGLSSKSIDPYDLKSTPPGEWDFVMSVPARGESTYSAVVPTLRDSTIADGMWWTAFFVSGIGENPLDHFDSPVDSGYSLDNLAPRPPSNLIASLDNSQVDLTWKSTAAEDFDYYHVYRDTTAEFSVDPGKRIGTTSDTVFVDSSVPIATEVYYRVSAVDFSGNEGLPSNATTPMVCACDCHANPECDSAVDILDVTRIVNIAFRNATPILDPEVSCPYQTNDVDCNNLTDIFDVIRMINVAFRNENPATQFCDPCP